MKRITLPDASTPLHSALVLVFSLLLFAAQAACAIEFTDGFTLRADTGEQVGILVGLPDFRGGHGKCVLMLAPDRPELAKSPLGLAISEGKNAGQLTWDKLEPALVVRHRGMGFLRISEEGAVVNSVGAVIGKAEPMPEKAKK
jgi:hypothetical protein